MPRPSNGYSRNECEGCADSGPIIHLSWIDRLRLLERLFEEVLLTPAVRDEILAAPAGTLGLDRIQQALSDGALEVRQLPSSSRGFAAGIGSLHLGETEVLRLAAEVGADLFFTDDGAARRVADARGISVIGTVGILRQGHIQGLVPAVLPLMLELRRLGQWLSDELIDQVRQEEEGLA